MADTPAHLNSHGPARGLVDDLVDDLVGDLVSGLADDSADEQAGDLVDDLVDVLVDGSSADRKRSSPAGALPSPPCCCCDSRGRSCALPGTPGHFDARMGGTRTFSSTGRSLTHLPG